MKKINEFNYQEGTIVVEFFETEEGSGRFFFSIRDIIENKIQKDLMKLFKQKEVKREKDIFFCARGIFDKIRELNGAKIPDYNKNQPIRISFSESEKGGFDHGIWWKLSIIHTKGNMVKAFKINIGDELPNDSSTAWLHIFFYKGNETIEEYRVFLKESFGIALPNDFNYFEKLDTHEINTFSFSEKDYKKILEFRQSNNFIYS